MNEQAVNNPQTSAVTPTIEEDFVILMSLRLDGLLEGEDLRRFDECVAQRPALAAQWQEWQQLHGWFDCAPHKELPANLAANVMRTLVQQDRRRRLWQGLLFGSFVIMLWSSMALVAVWLGALLLVNDGSWISNVIQNLAFLSLVVNQWWTRTSALFVALSESPQAIGAGLCYIALAVVMLSFWIRFLHRSTQDDERAERVTVIA